MEQQRDALSDEMEKDWLATPARSRESRDALDNRKTVLRHSFEDELVTMARAEWQRRLAQAGLRDEDWDDMTFTETLAVERALAGDLDLDAEGMAIMETVIRAEYPPSNGVISPPESVAASSLSASPSYDFVSPLTFSVEDEVDEDGRAFESMFPFEIVSQPARFLIYS